MVSFPPSGAFLSSIRESSRTLRQAAQVSISHKSITRLLTSPAFTASFKRVSATHGLALPLKFSSALDELNLLSVLSVLNFASGYRAQLHAETGRGAWDSIRAFVFALYITSSTGEGDLLSAIGMQKIGDAKVAELMGVNVHIERPHETIAGITVGELGGPMHELVKLITGTMNETGRVLIDMGYPNLGAFVAEALKEGERMRLKQDSHMNVEIILERLVRAIPSFQDMAEVEGQPIYCFKKALFLIHAINVRFGSMSPPPFPIPSTSHIPVFTDNVLPSLLIHLGVIDVSDSPSLASLFPPPSESKLQALLGPTSYNELTSSKSVPKEGPVLTSDQAYILRAAAIDACEMIVDVAQSWNSEELADWVREIRLPELDIWIWAVAKDRPDYRALERFVLKNTVFF